MKTYRWYKYQILENGKVEIYQNNKLVHTASSWYYADEYMNADLIY